MPPYVLGMIVCLCNAISDRAACAVARDGGCRNVGDIYRCLGCRVQCGKCVPELRRLLEEARAQAREALAREREAGELPPGAAGPSRTG